MPCGAGGDASFLFIPDLTDKATGAVLVVADHPLRRLAAGVDAADVDDDRQHPADDLPRAAVPLRRLHPALPGRPAALLDHDQPVDDRAAGDHPEAARPDAATGTGQRARQPRRSVTWRRLAPPRGRRGAGADGGRTGGSSGRARRQGAPRAGRRPARRRRRRKKKNVPGGADERGRAGRSSPRAAREGRREALGLDADVVDGHEDDDGIRGTLDGDDLGLFIGRHGQTIDAVQHLAFKVANRDAGRDEACG